MNQSVVEESEERKSEKYIKRHAQESWLYPIASVVLTILGFPIAFLNVFTFIMGIYCLVKSYMNIKNGYRKGIVGHVIVGTIFNVVYVVLNAMTIYAIYVGPSA